MRCRIQPDWCQYICQETVACDSCNLGRRNSHTISLTILAPRIQACELLLTYWGFYWNKLPPLLQQSWTIICLCLNGTWSDNSMQCCTTSVHPRSISLVEQITGKLSSRSFRLCIFSSDKPPLLFHTHLYIQSWVHRCMSTRFSIVVCYKGGCYIQIVWNKEYNADCIWHTGHKVPSCLGISVRSNHHWFMSC